MRIYLDTTTNEVVITHNEKIKRKTVAHKHKGIPLAYQYHPHPNYSNEIIRVVFEGRSPNWIRNKSNHYKMDIVFSDTQQGWWLSTWNNGSTGLFLTPSLQGAISMMIERIPEEFTELRELVETNRDVIAKNLRYDCLIYSSYGVYYRRESVNGIQGALYISPDLLIKQRSDEEREDYLERFAKSGFSDFIQDAIEPLDYDDEDVYEEDIPPIEEEDTEIEQEEEILIVEDTEGAETEFEWEEEILMVEDTEVTETEFEWEEEILMVEDTEVTETEVEQEEKILTAEVAEVAETKKDEELKVLHEPVTNIDGIYEKIGLHVAKITSKRGDSMEGQLVFF